MEAVNNFACSKEGRKRYPKLKAALKDLDTIIGMNDVKESLANEIKQLIAYEMLDNPVSTSKVVTRSKKRGKGQKTRSRKKRKSRQGQVEITPSDMKKHIASIFANLQGVELIEDSDDESEWGPEEYEPAQSIRPERLQQLKLHTLILGKPGCGKTTLARKIAKIWEAIGLVNNTFHTISKGTIASKWQGESLQTIRELIRASANGVIFIDEAYSLVECAKDTYGNEVLSYIVFSMTNPDCHTTFIFAGYEKDCREKLLAVNQGLERRFSSIFLIKDPSIKELAQIFRVLLKKERGWKTLMQEQTIIDLFTTKKDLFKNAGGDVESIVRYCIKAHINRFFPERMNQKINSDDLKEGIKLFEKSKNRQKKNILPDLYL